MNLDKERRQRDEFRNILLVLAANQEMLQDGKTCNELYRRLEALYYSAQPEERFRHFYSDIFIVLTQIQQGQLEGSIDALGQNLEYLRSHYEPHMDAEGHCIDVSDSLQKLYDHVSLDIARIRYSEEGDRAASGEKTVSELKTQITETQGQLDKIKEDVHQEVASQKEELSKQQREYISILGIFAAVVLAFTGGIAFSTSVFENIDTISPYRIVAVSLIIGLVLVNILFGLFFYIDRLVNGAASKSVKPLWISNGVLLGLLLVVFIAWAAGLVEYRDKRMAGAEAAVTEAAVTEVTVTESAAEEAVEAAAAVAE